MKNITIIQPFHYRNVSDTELSNNTLAATWTLKAWNRANILRKLIWTRLRMCLYYMYASQDTLRHFMLDFTFQLRSAATTGTAGATAGVLRCGYSFHRCCKRGNMRYVISCVNFTHRNHTILSKRYQKVIYYLARAGVVQQLTQILRIWLVEMTKLTNHMGRCCTAIDPDLEDVIGRDDHTDQSHALLSWNKWIQYDV